MAALPLTTAQAWYQTPEVKYPVAESCPPGVIQLFEGPYQMAAIFADELY